MENPPNIVKTSKPNTDEKSKPNKNEKYFNEKSKPNITKNPPNFDENKDKFT